MDETVEKKGLELKEKELSIHSWFWISQKVGFAVIAFVLLLGILGVLGEGILSRKNYTDTSQTLSISFEKFIRVHTETKFTITINAADFLKNNNVIKIWFSRQQLSKSILTQITPEPYLQQIDNEKVIYFFSVNENTANFSINVWLEPKEAGFWQNAVGMVEGPQLTYSQFVYP